MKIKLTLCLLAFAQLINAQTTLVDSFMVGGIMRNFRAYIPAIYNVNTPVPLVFNLHGYTSNAAQQEFYGDFRPIADTANFIIVHPNGTTDPNGDQYWNNFDGSAVDDIGFLSTLIDTLSARFSINPNQIYSTGMSNGGFMSYELACFLNHRIAAIASVTGSMIPMHLNTCNAQHPTPVMEIHGTADNTVPYLGSATFVPIADLVNHWVTFNQCNATANVLTLPDINTADGCTAEHYLYSSGPNQATVEHYKIIGGGHTWPGAAFNIGVTNQDFSASKVIWRFFRQYKLNELVSGIEAKPSLIPLAVPNPSDGNFQLNLSNFSPSAILISDATGRVVKKIITNTPTITLNLEEKGLYNISILQNEKIQTQRILIK
jgi:polyhydroxybutyrate depolymerase